MKTSLVCSAGSTTLKRLAVFCCLSIMAFAAWAQGQISILNGSYSWVSTNSVSLGGGTGNTSPTPNGFYYGLFIAASTVISLSPLDLLTTSWTFTGTYATNTGNPTGGILSGGNSTQVSGWVDKTNSYVFAGWSANIAGPNWNAVAAQLTAASFRNGMWSGPNWLTSSDGGFFGVSMIGSGMAPDPVQALPSFNLFATQPYGTIPTPISTGWNLFVIKVPEPSGLALFAVCIVLSAAKRRCKCRPSPLTQE